MSRTNKDNQPKVRSKVAQDAHFATGAGTHGGGKKQKNKRERAQMKKELRDV